MSHANRSVLAKDLAAGALEPFVERRRSGQEGWFRVMFEQAPVAMAITSVEGQVELVNGAFTKLFGYGADEVRGMSVVELTHAEDRAKCREFVREVAGGAARRQYEKRYHRKDGTIIWALVTVSGAELNGRRYLIGQIVDLTAIKRANAEAHAAAALIANSQDAIVTASLDGRVTTWNAAAETMLGYAATEAIGLPIHGLFAPERREFIAMRLAALKAGGTLCNLETVLLRKDGTRLEAEITLSPIPEGDNPIARLSAIARDITVRKYAERQLLRKDAELREAQRVAHVGNWELDVASGRMTWSDEVFRIFGLDPMQPAPGMKQRILDPESDERLRRAMAATLASGAPHAEDCRLTHPHHGLRWVAVRGEPSRDADGRITVLRGTMQDITDRKLQERRLESSMEATVKALAGTVELRDPYTAGHQSRVAELAVLIGRELGLSDERLRGLDLAAGIHDIGKLCVPAEILAKPGRLTPIEYELIKSHSAAGARILEGIEFPWPIREMVWQHHERIDGKGYPRGLKGDEILLEARILAVADVMEAIASHRPYRAAKGLPAALAEIRRGRGAQYDAQVADACLRLYQEGRGVELGDAPAMTEERACP